MESLLESVTRCFNPLEGSPAGCVSSPCASASHVRQSTDGQQPQQQRDTSSSSAKSSQSSRRNSREAATPHQYDPDRYIHRKLEIFRARSDDDEVDRRIIEAQRRAAKRKKRGQEELAYSSDEIDELTRQAARQPQTNKKSKKTSESPFGVLNLICATTTAPFLGLCFATPVRTPSREDVSNLSDWKLTDEEFEARRRAQAENEASLACHADVQRCLYDSGDENLRGIPHADESSVSRSDEEEEETITSASYFESKYSHVVQTTPPMPLFEENRILVTESRDEEILRLVERRREQKRRARGDGVGTTQPNGKKTTPPRSSPPKNISTPNPGKKGGHSRSGSQGSLGSLTNRAAKTPKSANGKEASKSKTKRHRRRLSFGKGKGKRHEVPMTKSSTVSEASAAGVGDREGSISILTLPYEPEIVHSTAGM